MSSVNSNIDNHQLISKVVMAKKIVLLSPRANEPIALPPGGSQTTIVLTDTYVIFPFLAGFTKACTVLVVYYSDQPKRENLPIPPG